MLEKLESHLPLGFKITDKSPDGAQIEPITAFINTNEPSNSGTHDDDCQCIILVIEGEKVVYLAPHQNNLLRNDFMESDGKANAPSSGSNTYEDEYPCEDEASQNPQSLEVSELKFYTKVVLEAGDILIIPKRWPHCMKGSTGTVGLSMVAYDPRVNGRLTEK